MDLKRKAVVYIAFGFATSGSACSGVEKSPEPDSAETVGHPPLTRLAVQPPSTNENSGYGETSASSAARAFVEAVLNNDSIALDNLAEAAYRVEARSWVHPDVWPSHTAAAIESVVVTSNSSGSARVIVSVVVPELVGGVKVPPFAYEVQVLEGADHRWRVVAAEEVKA